MFEIYFIAQACCQLLLCAKQNHHHKFFCSHMEPWMDDYTGNEEHLYRVWQLPYTFNLHHLVRYMNNKNNMGIILQFEHIDTYAGLPPQSIFIFSLPMEWENEILEIFLHPQGVEKVKVSQNILLTPKGIFQNKCMSKGPHLWQTDLWKRKIAPNLCVNRAKSHRK